jgi:hypothetical protein
MAEEILMDVVEVLYGVVFISACGGCGVGLQL